MRPIKKYLLFICFISSSLFAQSNEELAKSYYLLAQEAYGNQSTIAAVKSLDQCVKMLGKTNAKIEALYIKIKEDIQLVWERPLNYYVFELKEHLDNYLKIASTDRIEYNDILKSAPNIYRKAEDYKKQLTVALKENSNRNWEERGPIYLDFVGYFNSKGEKAFDFPYRMGEKFDDGYAIIEKKGVDGFFKVLINKDGESFSSLPYSNIKKIASGIYKTQIKRDVDSYYSYYGLIYTKLKKELKYPSFAVTSIDEFENTNYLIFEFFYSENETLKGLINNEGEIIIKPFYVDIKLINNDTVEVSKYEKINGKEEYIKKTININ